MSLVGTRLGRLARTGSPRLATQAVAREFVARRDAAALARAASRGGRILAGPFVGEVGYELLYWIPYLRRILREHGVGPERVTVLTRGGAGSWYRDVAEAEIEILDLVGFEPFREGLRARRARAHDAKQMTNDPFDRELVERARRHVGDAFVLHPRLMYARLRFVWEGLLAAERAAMLCDYRPIAAPADIMPPGAVLPERFIAVKAYFSDVLPASPTTRAFLERLVGRLAESTAVVVLANAEMPDEHEEWGFSGGKVVSAMPWLRPRDNLAVQTQIVRAADALICTYGGFSYLGPLLGVRTLALHTGTADNPRHLDVAQSVLSGPRLELIRVKGADTADAVASRLAGVGAA